MLQRISTTGDEPVSLADAKVAARVDGDELDALISGYITAARQQAEQITGRAYRAGTWAWTGSDWPCDRIAILGVAAARVKRWDGSALVTVAPQGYVCAPAADRPGTEVVPALGAAWPDLPSIAAGARVVIELDVAVDPDDVGDSVKTYIKAQVASWLKNPEAMVSSSLVRNPLLDRLLDSELVIYC